MSDPVAIALISGLVTTVGAIVGGIVAVVKLWREVKSTNTSVDAIPAHVTDEAEKTRAVVEQSVGVVAARLVGDGSPDDVAAGAVHTHQRKAEAKP